MYLLSVVNRLLPLVNSAFQRLRDVRHKIISKDVLERFKARIGTVTVPSNIRPGRVELFYYIIIIIILFTSLRETERLKRRGRRIRRRHY